MISLADIGFVEVCDERILRISPGRISFCEWLVTPRCNFSCPYCNRLEETPDSEPDMTEVARVVGILAGMGCGYVQLTGGEPTVRLDLPEIVALIRSRGIRAGLSTNGSRSLPYYQNLIDAGVSQLSISLDVHQRDLNPHFTQVPSRIFDRVVANIVALSRQVRTTVGIVLTRENIGMHRQVIEFVSSLGVADIRIGTATQHDRVPPLTVAEEVLARHPILRFRVDNFNRGQNMRGSLLARTPRCHLVRDDVTLLGGRLYPCSVYAREGGRPLGTFGADNKAMRLAWAERHDSHSDPICLRYCMDFKCRYNDKFEACLSASHTGMIAK
jgi:MoaA/NifB/PqqE/SkfB family radical SAM enzyme